MLRIVTTFSLLLGIFLFSLMALLSISRRTPSTAAWIVFSSERLGISQIYRMRPDGSSVQRVSKTPDWYSFPTFSPDGHDLTVVVDANQTYKLYQLENGLPSAPVGDIRFVSYPRWSPDSEWIALSAESDGRRYIFRMRPDGSQFEQLTNGDSFDSAPTFSPDGEWLIFESIAFNERQRIFRMKADGTLREQLNISVVGPHSPSWSPDGEWVVFTGYENTKTDLFLTRPDGTDEIRLTDHSEEDFQANWSPDSQWIIFASNRTGNADIFRMRVDGSEVIQLTDHPANDLLPRWSPIIDLTWSGLFLSGIGIVLVAGAPIFARWGRKNEQ